MSSTNPETRTDAVFSDEPVLEVASVSQLAVVGFILSLLSALAPIHPVLWALPVVAIVVDLWALARINHYWPELAGRPLAWAGLSLAIVFGVAGPAHVFGRQWLFDLEAQRFAAAFFDYLRDDQPQLAHQLTLEPEVRQPFDGQLWAKYRASSPRLEALEEFTAAPVIRALLALGPRATVRYYGDERYQRSQNQEVAYRLYSVTYLDDDGRRRSFFVRLILIRRLDEEGVYSWYARVDGPIEPVDDSKGVVTSKPAA